MKRIWLPQIIAMLFLIWALNPTNPYGYYRLLRVVCFIVFAYLSYKSIIFHQKDWTWVLGTGAVIYNPLIPLHMTRGIWTVVNLATAILLCASIFFINPSRGR
jgi:hypothetical protein